MAVDMDVVFNQPFASSSSARRNGEKGEDCLRTEGPSSAAARCGWAAQRPRRKPGDAVGARFLWLLSFGKTKESTHARQARKTAPRQPAL